MSLRARTKNVIMWLRSWQWLYRICTQLSHFLNNQPSSPLLCTLSYSSLETTTRPQSHHSSWIESTSGCLSHHFTTPKPPPGKFTSLAMSFSRRPSIAAWHAGLHIREFFTPLPVFESLRPSQQTTASSRHSPALPNNRSATVLPQAQSPRT
jgi:hypothetical protein